MQQKAWAEKEVSRGANARAGPTDLGDHADNEALLLYVIGLDGIRILKDLA